MAKKQLEQKQNNIVWVCGGGNNFKIYAQRPKGNDAKGEESRRWRSTHLCLVPAGHVFVVWPCGAASSGIKLNTNCDNATAAACELEKKLRLTRLNWGQPGFGSRLHNLLLFDIYFDGACEIKSAS